MITRTTITCITHDDLVDFLSAVSTGSQWLTIDAEDELYNNKRYRLQGDTVEDILAAILLDRKKILVSDYYAEDEEDFYGHLPSRWDEEQKCMVYEVGIEDIAKGIADALDNDNKWDTECAMDLINNEGDLDLPEAEELMQVIVFGEGIYG